MGIDPLYDAGFMAGVRTSGAEIERLRAALKPFADFDPSGWSGPMLKGFHRMGREALLRKADFDAAHAAVQQSSSLTEQEKKP